ncbi:MAG: ATP synthase F1 subunit delta [Cyanobacteria bacterium SIG27]|nr:ATP synthase F1 subunit delta [Cyanobacteria bacterium SIG27]
MASSVKQNCKTVAKRWANALMELTSEDNSISKDAVLKDLRDIVETINSSQELLNVINNPSVTVLEKQNVITKLFKSSIMPIVYNFLYVLNLRKRLGAIFEIANEYEKKLEKFKNIIRIDVTSAIDLSDEKKEDIKTKISQKLNKNILVDWKVNNNIIAGLIFKIDETIIDNSVRCKLESLGRVIARS